MIKIKGLKLKKILNKNDLNEVLFFSVLWIYFGYYFLTISCYLTTLPASVISLFKYPILLLVGVRWAFIDRYGKKKIAVYGVILAVTFIVTITGGYEQLLLSIIIILSTSHIEYEKIMKKLFNYLVGWTGFIVLSCFAGILKDNTFSHMGLTAHSLGFTYYSGLGNACMLGTMLDVYNHRRNYSNLRLITTIVLNLFLCIIHTNRTSLAITILFLFWFMLTRNGYSRLIEKTVKFASYTLPSLCMLFILVFFTNKKFSVLFHNPFLRTFESRILLSNQAVNQYGLHIFATPISMVGATSQTYGGASYYNYIDSGFLYYTLAYGLLFTIVLVIICTVVLRYLYKTNRYLLFGWFSLFMLCNIFTNILLNIFYDPILFLIPFAFKLGKKNIMDDSKINGVIRKWFR